MLKKGNKVLELFEQDKRIVPYIISESDICNDIISKVKIGSGSQGKVYKIKFRNDRKTYIMKKSYLHLYHLTDTEAEDITKYISKKVKNVSKLTMKQFMFMIMDFYDLHGRISWKKLLNYNHFTRDMVPSYDLLYEFFIPAEDIDCRVSKHADYPYNLDISGTVHVEPGDYVCFSSIFVETVISLLISKLVRENICYHYTVFYSSIVCNDTFTFYIEKMDLSLLDLLFDTDVEVHDAFDVSNLFSIVVSIMIMSEKYSICHNDLAFRNILVKRSDKLERFEEATTISYVINDIIFEFPFPNYLYKISDFGYSQKFSHPMMLDNETMTLNESYIPNFDTHGLFDIFKFFNDVVLYIYRDVPDIKKYVDPFLVSLFGTKNKAIDMILDSNRHEEVVIDVVRDVILESQLILNTNYLKRVFKDFIVNEKSVDTFVAAEYHSS